MPRCKARDEGRIQHTTPWSATPHMGIIRVNLLGLGFPGGLLCRAACKGEWPFAAHRFAHAIPENGRRGHAGFNQRFPYATNRCR